MNKTISVIIPIFNSSKTLERTLESIINQAYRNLEIILVNDGSNDNSLEICERYANRDSRIVIVNQKNQGVGKARNYGIDVSTGDFISFVDSDDTIDENYFEVLISAMMKYNLDMVGSDIRVVFDNQIIYPYKKEINGSILNKEQTIKNYLNFKISSAVWGKLYKRELIDKTRFPSININEDFIFEWEIFKKCNMFSKTNDTHYNYYANTTNSLTKKQFSENNMSIIHHANQVVYDTYKLYPHLSLDAKDYFYACVLHNLVIYYNYIKNCDCDELYVNEKRIMEDLLKGKSKLNSCLLSYEQDIDIKKLMQEINEVILSKEGGKKCL